MTNLDDLEKLHQLKEKGIISETEFAQQKSKLLQQSGKKNQLAYCLLAFFLGIFGVHNFYAGRWKRGLTQLLITLLTFFVGVIFTHLWAIINIFTIHTDAKGNEFEPCKTGKYVCGILGILGYLWSVLGVMVIAGIAGYSSAMARYKANELINYSAQISVLARAQNGGMGILSPEKCASLGVPQPEFFTGGCIVYPDGKVVFSGVNDRTIKREMIKNGMKYEYNTGDVIFSLGEDFY